MRLIDADKLIKSYRKLAAIEWNQTVFPKSWADAYESFIDDIEEAPTIQPQGIDKDRLIEELESIASRYPYKVVGQPETYGEYNMAWQDCIDVVEQAIEKTQPTSDGWIPVSSGKLPKVKDRVLITYVQTQGYILRLIAYLGEDGNWYSDVFDWILDKDDEAVLAWQPLPQPYKESE